MVMEINGFPKYLIYENGDVYSKKTNIILKQSLDKGGYYKLELCKDGKPKTFKVHRLIALHYISNPENKPCIDHIDRNRQNNDISNLRWATHTENMNNKGIPSTNTSGHKNISYYKQQNVWRFSKARYKTKYFKTIEEAIDYKLTITIN